ncbi:MAG: DUF488 family protein [Planctomycetota bacterium]
MIRDKSVYDPPAPEDGHRVLVMRIVRDPAIHELPYDTWIKSLSPSLDTLNRWWAKEITTPEMYAEFRETISEHGLRRLRKLEQEHGTVTILCRERRPHACHRYELKRIYLERYPDAAEPKAQRHPKPKK